MRAPIAFAIGCIATTLFTDSVMAVHCNKHHTVVNGETCQIIAETYNITENVIDRLNPSAVSICDNLEDGLKLCVSSSIKSLNKPTHVATPTVADTKETTTVSSKKKTVHTKQKATTLFKSISSKKKSTSKKQTKKKLTASTKKQTSKKHTSKKHSSKKHSTKKHSTTTIKKHTSKKEATKTGKSDAAVPTAAVRNKKHTSKKEETKTVAPTKSSKKHTSKKESTKAGKSGAAAIPTPAARHKKEDSVDAAEYDPTTTASQPEPTDGANPTKAPTGEPTESDAPSSGNGAAAGPGVPSDNGSDNATNGSSNSTDPLPPNGPPSGNQTNSTQPPLNYFDGLTVQLTSADDFCLLLPSSPGGKKDNHNKIDIEAISKSETSAVSFCLKKSSELAPKARQMPTDFIQSAYYFKNETADYIQVSGRINPKAYMLSEKDYGGQYDNHGRGAPKNSMCYGYRYFVELIEPNSNDFCIRCCSTYEDCNAGRSAYGCQRVVSNGRYY